MTGLLLLLWSCLGRDGLHHAFHLHGARSLDEHAADMRQAREHGGAERVELIEMTTVRIAPERGDGVGRRVAE
eukprot:gene11951-15946_t